MDTSSGPSKGVDDLQKKSTSKVRKRTSTTSSKSENRSGGGNARPSSSATSGATNGSKIRKSTSSHSTTTETQDTEPSRKAPPSTGRFYRKQLYALFWKGAIIRRVHYIATFFEFIGPLLIPLTLFHNLPRSLSPSGDHPIIPVGPHISTSAESIDFYFKEDDFGDTKQTIVYTPDTNQTRALVASLVTSGQQVRPVKNGAVLMSLLEGVITGVGDEHLGIMGVEFHQQHSGQLSYTLYKPTNVEFAETIAPQGFPIKYNKEPADTILPYYLRLLQIIGYIARDYIGGFCSGGGEQNQTTTACKILFDSFKPLNVYRMPYPEHPKDTTFSEMNIFDYLAVIVTQGYILLVPLIVKRITEEKSTKAKELLTMIGMSDVIFWAAHFLNYFFNILLQSALMAYILFGTSQPLMAKSSGSLFFLLCLLYGAQVILFSLLISTFFTSTVIAEIVTTILWINAAIASHRTLVPSVCKCPIAPYNGYRRWLTLLPTSSITFLFSILGDLEQKGHGLSWSTLTFNGGIYEDYTPLTILLLVAVSLPMYALLIWYFDAVWPWQPGIPRSPVFLFQPSYWRPKVTPVDKANKAPKMDPTKFQRYNKSSKERIVLRNVFKTFSGRPTPVVEGLWLKIYDNSLTVLLGHNGAGKTTTMNMITGMFAPTSGTIHVDGYNVSTATTAARQSIGLCPQENIYFSELSVSQHLWLFAMLKDFSEANIYKEITYLLEMLDLVDKRNELASNLSGGMKRKLALGMALVGGTKTLILDEPTSGMDPEARRVIWDLLLSLRRSRTILLTTHYMEEADVLADRIAIMNHGKLCCLGSPMFLKSAFGTGYRLRISKDGGGSGHFQTEKFTAHLKKHYFTKATLVSEVETEIVYSLEADKSKKTEVMKKMQQLFDDVEKNKEQYGIESCGLSYTTMEDVFLITAVDGGTKVTEAEEPQGPKSSKTSMSTKRSSKKTSSSSIHSTEKKPSLILTSAEHLLQGYHLFRSQFFGLLLKRFYFSRHYWPMLVWQLVLPAAILTSGLYRRQPDDMTVQKTAPFQLNVQSLYGSDTETFFCTGKGGFGGDLVKHYEAVHEKGGRNPAKVTSLSTDTNPDAINQWALAAGNASLSNYIANYLYGLEAHTAENNPPLTSWFNAEQYHSLPLAIIVLFETLLRSVLPSSSTTTDSIGFNISAVYLYKRTKAFSSKKKESIEPVLIGWAIDALLKWGFLCLVFMPIAFTFLGASYIILPVKERLTKSKLLQLMTGTSSRLYWFTNMLYDLATHLLATLVLFIVIYFFISDIFTSGLNTAPILLLLLLGYGFATIPYAYLLSNYYDSPTSGFVWLTIQNMAIGFILHAFFAGLNLAHYIDTVSGRSEMDSVAIPAIGASYLVNAIPIFAFIFGYQKIYLMSQMSSICTKLPEHFLQVVCASMAPDNKHQKGFATLFKGCCSPDICLNECFTLANAVAVKFGGLSAGTELLYLFGCGVLYFVLVVLLEGTCFSQISAKFSRAIAAATATDQRIVEDEDVTAERERVEGQVAAKGSALSSLLTVYKLRKTFKSFVAVDGLSFGVKDNEIFGFLGVNGAGKTTTFSMLVGDITPTSGDAYLNYSGSPISLLKNLTSFRKSLGYCPQFDALLEELTGNETLAFFSRLRGLPMKTRQRDINRLVAMVGLEEYRDKVVGSYSGGNKRKLSIAIALIGSPCLLLLDEPSAGVDPTSRRKIWQLLGSLKRQQRCSILLTSHSMEECEALCSRIAIMVQGRFVCLGSAQHLRSKFGQGYTVIIRLARKHEGDRVYAEKIHNEVRARLPSAVLKDLHQCVLHYHLPDKSQSWSTIFATLNRLNEVFTFEDYTVTDTTLEQIFITFARHQTASGGQEPPKKK